MDEQAAEKAVLGQALRADSLAALMASRKVDKGNVAIRTWQSRVPGAPRSKAAQPVVASTTVMITPTGDAENPSRIG